MLVTFDLVLSRISQCGRTSAIRRRWVLASRKFFNMDLFCRI